MDYKKIGDNFYIRLDKDDKVFQSLQNICEKEHIFSGHLQGIGACSNATVSFYQPKLKKFQQHTVTGMLEIVSLLGNVVQSADRKPQLHLHAIFSYLSDNSQPSVLAGHLVEATINYTGEIVLFPTQGTITLAPDTKTEIDIWHFNQGDNHEGT